ncbi:histone acetylation protein-domain-containing protein [Gongronella butleri]|nr:histone acetylation protein-domain-containing protein [Gongronella butleri]
MLASCLKKYLSTLGGETRTYKVYQLTKKASSREPLTAGDDTRETQRLILVAHGDECFVSGLEIFEYTSVRRSDDSKDGKETTRRTVYISKIDTTGHAAARGVTKRLVLAYLASQPAGTTVHVFARAQPQYLFAQSAKDARKRVLSDRQLVKWWYQVLDGVDGTRFWSVPGVDDELTALLDIGQPRPPIGDSTPTRWHYGHAYKRDALAQNVIPRFPDDSKARFLASVDQPDLTVDDYWTLLGYSEECGAGKLTGIFVVELKTKNEENDASDGDNDDDNAMEDDTYTHLWNEFMDLQFDSDATNASSWQKWKKACLAHARQFEVTTLGTSPDTNAPAGGSGAPVHVTTLAPKKKGDAAPIHTLTVKRPANNHHDAEKTTIHVLTPKRRKQ